MATLHRFFAFLPFVLVACGGNIDKVSDSNGANGAGGSSSSSSGGGAGGDRAGGNCTMAPSCNEGDTSFASSDAACIEITGMSCYERSACGSTIWCQHSDTACQDAPTCKPGWAEVKGCVPDSECEKLTVCGKSIICQNICEGPQPVCDPGDTQVANQTECLQDDAKCYSRTSCSYTIWCTGPQ
jgi:hypothetical protein